jgi:hypothetical protein
MTPTDAVELQAIADAILGRASAMRSEIGGAVNWADLRCTDVSVSLLSGLVTITIEEASPQGADRLRQHVSEELAKAGWPDIAVLTEW